MPFGVSLGYGGRERSRGGFPAFELILVTKNLERIGNHATINAYDVICMAVGRDLRHPALNHR